MLIGERFGKLPWEVEDAPYDRLQYYLGILGVEGEVKGDLSGVGPDEPVHWTDEG